MNSLSHLAFSGVFFTALVSGAGAQETANPAQLAWEAASKAAIEGPSDVTLSDQAVFHMSQDMVFVPKTEGAKLMEAWGNSVGPGFHGLVFPKAQDQLWTISIDHVAEGYVKDDDAKTWNADELLQSLKDGTAAQNEEREKMGIPALDIIGWVQAPNYDATKHQLVWSLKAKSRAAAEGDALTINYNTYALGRDGYFEINLLTDDKHVDADKKFAHRVIAAVDYSQGKRYADFNAATDHVAEYGLAALVGGVAAKKLGLLAVLGAFVAKFAKVILAAVVVGGAGIAKLFRRNSA